MRQFHRKGGLYRKVRPPMENKASFQSFWRKNCPEEPLPELLELFDSQERLQQRVDLCKQNLNGALNIFKKEGLVLRFLSKVLDSSDYDDFKGEVCGSLRLVFSDSLGFATEVNDLQSESSDELCRSADGAAERSLEKEQVADDPFLIRGDSFAFTIDTKIKENRGKTIERLENESESGPELGGSDSHLQASADLNESHSHSSTETSVGANTELFNNQNDKVFLSRESLPNVDINYEGRSEILSNEDGEFGDEYNQQLLMAARDSGQFQSMDGKSSDSQASKLKEDVQDIGSVPLNAVCGPFKTEFWPKERKCKWNVEKSSGKDRWGLRGSYNLHTDTEMTNSSETKPFESHKTEDGNKSQNIGIKVTEAQESKSEGDSLDIKNMSSEQERVNDKSIEIKEKNEDSNLDISDHEDRPTLAEEETFFDSTEEKEALDSHDVIDQQGTGIVDDLISYLEGIEMANSSEEEGDSAWESSSNLPFGYQGKPNGIFRKKQLQSVMSTTSALSGDSCLSPWALEMAMAEIHSADSSDPEDTPAESSEPSPIDTVPKEVGDTSGNDTNISGTPPVRPPRKRSKKGMVRAHTVGTPKEIRPSIRGYSEEDEVFRKEEEGYDGDQENQALSQSHANISAIKDNSVQFRSLLDTGEDDRRKLRRSRGSNVILDQDNVDFPSSPLSSPNHSKNEIDVFSEDDAQKLQNRKWVASAVLDSEKSYLECLNTLHKYMKPLRASLATSAPILSTHDFKKIFFKVEELFKIHDKFYSDLELRVSNWNVRQIIGDLFLSLVYQFDVYREYIQNYKTAMDTIHKCKTNEQFNQIFSKEIKLKCSQEITTLESLFSKPVDRIGRYVTSLSDLLKQTPNEHPDHGILLEVQVITKEFLAKVTGGDQRDGPPVPRVKRDHRLIKDGFLVELSDGIRKFRHIFLFNDVLLCTKRKLTARQEHYVCKWHILLSDLLFHPHDHSEATQMVPVASEADIELLKGRIVSLKSEIRKEQGPTGQGPSPDESPSTKRKRAQSTNKAIEKLKKKLAQQEAALLLAIPSLPFHLYHKKTPKTYTLLCKSDVQRAEWKESILSQQGQDNPPGGHLSVLEVQSLVEACKKFEEDFPLCYVLVADSKAEFQIKLRTCKTFGKVSIEEDKELLNGLLYVDIQNGKGFHRSDLYCVLEVDHYGQFVRKAKTKICKATGDPVWNQDFDIEVEGSKELRLHVFGKSRYALMSDEECGHGKIMLTRENLTDQKKRTITIALDKQGAITLSIQYSKTLQGIQRKKSISDSGVFGVDIETVTSREKCDIPLIVIGCVREVEKRGTDEVGIYRLSGASSDVRRLKDAFNENSQSALVQLLDADIHAVSGLLKSYLRELPEPLFTDQLYNTFVDTYGISDKEEKKNRMLELLDSLPTPNRLTAVYLFEHLRRVGNCSDINKMGLNNLATVFGPNVLRPSLKTSSPMDLSQGTLDVMSQVGIFLYFLKSDSERTMLPDDPQLKNRLDPNWSAADDGSDRLI